MCDVLKYNSDKDAEGNAAPLQYPPPFYYGPAAPPGIPPMYYPPPSLHAMWGYGYPYWPPQQSYTTATMQHLQASNNTGNVDVIRNEPCNVSREDAKESREFPEIVDSPCNVEMEDMHDAVTDTSPDSRTNEPRLSLSSLKRDYSSSSSAATTPTSTNSTHRHDNNSVTPLPQQPLDVSNFEQQVMEFTSRRTKMIRNIKARPLNLPTDNTNTGNKQQVKMTCLC